MTPDAERPDRGSRAAVRIATVFGVGRAPVAPGTFGSVPGIALLWLLVRFGGTPAAVAGVAVVSLAGFWAAGRAARAMGRPDPGAVVVDEAAGQMLTLLFLPLTPRVLIAGFLLFRLLDVLKPPPVRQLERLPGGSGIMADDLAAGVYGNLLLQALVAFLPGWLGVP